MTLRQWIPGWAWQRRAFCYRELAVLLRAGLRVDRALELLAERRVGGVHATAWGASLTGVRAGRPLHEVLALDPWTIPAIERAALRAAETTGRQDWLLDRMAERLDRQAGLLGSLLLRLAYPFLLLHLVLVVQALVATPGAPGVALASALLHAVVLDALLAAGVWWFRRWADRSPRAEHIPLLGAALRATSQRQFLEAFALLHGSGVDLREAHAEATAAVARPIARARFQAAGASVAQGAQLTQGLALSGALEPEVLGMLQLGEVAGELESATTRACALIEHRENTLLARLVRVAFGTTYALAVILVASTVLRFYGRYYGGRFGF